MKRKAARPGTTGKAGDRGDDVAGLVEVADESSRHHLLASGFLLGVAVAGAMAVFIVQNTESIGFRWLWFDFDADMWLMLLVAFLAGLVAGPLVIAGWRHAARRQADRRRVVARFNQRRGATAGPRTHGDA